MKRYSLLYYLLFTIHFSLFTFHFSLLAQENEVKNLPKYDRQVFHPGFLLGFNVAHFRVQLADDFRFRDTVYNVTPHGVAGLNLGIIFGVTLSPHFDLRFIPALAFTQRNLEYSLVFP